MTVAGMDTTMMSSGAQAFTVKRMTMKLTMLMMVESTLKVALMIWMGRDPASRLAFSIRA